MKISDSTVLPQLDAFDLSNRLRTNIYPSSTEITTLSELVSKGQKALYSYRGSRKSNIIKKKRKTLAQVMTMVKALLSPIRRLPVELMHEIFLFACASYCRSSYTSAVLKLSSVCTHWRNIMLAIPSMWSNLRVRFDPDGELCHALVVETMLGRSKNHLLTLDVIVGNNYSNDDSESDSEEDAEENNYPEDEVQQAVAVKMLLQSCSRWQDVALEGSELVDFLYIKLIGAFDNLEILKITYRPDLSEVDDESEPIACFDNAPRLHTALINGVGPELIIPWEQIQHFTVRKTHTTDYISPISWCSNLSSATITVTFDWHSPLDTFVVLPYLTSLNFKVLSETEFPAAVFSSLTLPALTSIHATCVPGSQFYDVNGWPMDDFSAFISRSECRITTLNLQHLRFTPQDLITLFRLVPSLVALTIHEPDIRRWHAEPGDAFTPWDWDEMTRKYPPEITEEVVRLMCPLDHTTILLPRLETLDITVRGPEFPDELFLEMLHSRLLSTSQDVSPLKSVRLELTERECSWEPDFCAPPLDSLGLKLTVEEMTAISF